MVVSLGEQERAYCLMGNHYHVVLEAPNANLVARMAWLRSSGCVWMIHVRRNYRC